MRWSRRTLVLAVLLSFGAVAGQVRAQEPANDECLACHGMEGISGPEGEDLFVSSDGFAASVHRSLPCAACHPDAEPVPHEQEPARPGPDACSMCHSEVVETYLQSIHGQSRANGASDAAVCTSCHGPAHAIASASSPQSPVYPLNLPRTCGQCHGDPDLAARYGIPVADAYRLYMDSIHGRALTQSGLLVAANCSSCHGSHGIRPKNDPQSQVFRRNVPSTCGSCHAGVERDYLEGTHGQAVAKGSLAAPVCVDCHSAHQIARVETEAWKLQIVSECGTCHEESLKTYRDTLHGQVTALGFTTVARCSDCHGSHRVLPESHPDSQVGNGNRVATCQKCHPGANENFAKFSPHADHADRERYPSLYYTAAFMNVLIVGVFAFFGLHTILWLIRSLIEQRAVRRHGRSGRSGRG